MCMCVCVSLSLSVCVCVCSPVELLKCSAWHTVKWECAVGCIISDCSLS